MKRIWCCLIFCAWLCPDAAAQKKKAKPAKQAPATVQLQHEGQYRARRGTFRLTRPAISSLDSGARTRIHIGGMQMPKGTYGFANGHIILKPAGARSTGTATGSGAVGTGTSPGSIGTSGPAMGVNGKNPYAGSGIYGTGIPFVQDSTKRQ